MTTQSPQQSTASPSVALPPAQSDGPGILLDLALEASAATGAALLVPEGAMLAVLQSRGANAPAVGELLVLEGSVAGEAWYRGRMVSGAEPPPRARQAALWQDERTIDVMAVPVMTAGRPVAVFMLYHRHLGHFRRSDATTLSRLASLASSLWSTSPGAPGLSHPRNAHEARAAARMALLAAGSLDEAGAWAEVGRTAAAVVEAPSARVSIIEGDELVCLGATGKFSPDLGRRRPRDFGFEGVALETIDGVLATDWVPEAGAAAPASWIRSLVSVPLRRMEQLIGVITVADETVGRFGEADREALLRFAIHATAALNESRLQHDAERHVAEGRLASEVAAALAAAEDTPSLRRTIAREFRRALGADGVRLVETIQHHVATTAVDGELTLVSRPPEPGRRLLCGHELMPGELTHRCVIPDGQGFLLVAGLGQVTDHPGCLQLVRRRQPFQPGEEDLLRRLAGIAELALVSRLTNIRLSQYADRIRSVAEVSASLHQSLRPVDAMSQAAEMLRRALGVSTVRIALVDEVWQELTFPISRRGSEVRDGIRRPLERGLLEEVWRTGRTYFFPQNAGEEALGLGLSLDTQPRCFAAVPLRLRGTIAGVVVIEDEAHDHAFEIEDVRILEIVAQQLGVTLENLESLEEERRQRITAEWLRQMARTATDTEARPAQIFELATDAAFQGIGGACALAAFLPGDGTTLVITSRGPVQRPWIEPRPIDGSIAGWMLDEQGAVFISANLAEDPRLSAEARQCSGALALAAVPIWCENRITAVLQLARPVGTSFAVADVERLAQIADHAGAGYQTAMAGEALRKSEERYRRLFSAATDAIVTLDRTGVITSFNEAAERLWNVRARAVVGGRWDVVLPFDAPEVVAEQVGRVLGGASCAFEAGLRRPDGERGVLALTISPLVEDGLTTTVLCIVRDVTDQRRVQAQLLQAEKMSAIGQLVGGMAHEINNPLASIVVNMELLLSEAKDSAQLETLTAIKVETDRAAQIVRNLLTYVRGQGSDRAVVDLREAVRGAVALRRNQLLNQQIEVLVELPAEVVPVWGNTVNLQQVLMNLLVNAEHAIRAHRGRGHVWIRFTAEEGRAAVVVDDDGPGVPPELLNRVFDPFYTTKPEGEGTGLGLSVSAGIVADHGGRITAAQRPGGGARFTVELPISHAEPAGPEVAAPRPVLPPGAPARRGRILLVDDEPDIRRSISKFLTRIGWEVDLADSGDEGLRQLAGSTYSVVLCDLRMPGMSGHEFYRRLESMASPAIATLIFMTGDVLSPEASRFLQEAGRPVLSKPFALKDLMEVLAQVVPA
ncbi:MAG: GAF domain-containing protein [Gemmatimonadota bacterium]|mgnify:CR=1 FL=1|nr:GAF domain-containing protein [Gemmatimonadota bacterium]